MFALRVLSAFFEYLLLCTSYNNKLHINMKPFKCHRNYNKKHFNRSLNKGVMVWQKIPIYFLWSTILCR